MYRIGVISDTHGYLDPQLERLFKGVDHILHAGDVGQPWLVMELESIAPVTAVLGNTDYDLNLRSTEVLRLAGRKILLHHIVSLPTPDPLIGGRIAREKPDLVVFGHTHRSHLKRTDLVTYLNPGYAGRRNMGVSRSVATIECRDADMCIQFHDLEVSSRE
jgi:hypothetical protein